MSENRSTPFEPERYGFSLSDAERSQLMGFALRQALIWAFCAGVVWYLIWLLMPSDEPIWAGIVFIAMIFVGVFVWKRRAYLRRVEMIWEAAAKRNRLDELGIDLKSESTKQPERNN